MEDLGCDYNRTVISVSTLLNKSSEQKNEMSDERGRTTQGIKVLRKTGEDMVFYEQFK